MRASTALQLLLLPCALSFQSCARNPGGSSNTSSGSQTPQPEPKPSPTSLLFFSASSGTKEHKNESDGIGIDSQGNVVMAGPFSGTRQFAGHTFVSTGPNDVYVVKLGPDGSLLNFLTITSIAGTGEENSFDLAIDGSDNVYLSGSYTESIKIGATTLDKNGPAEQYLAKLDSQLNPIWAKQFGGPGSDGGNELAVADDQTLVVSAMSDGPTYEGIPTTGGRDAFVLRVSTSDGQLLSPPFAFGGAGDAQIRALAADANDHILVGFEFSGALDYGATHLNAAAASLPPTSQDRTIADGALFYLNGSGVEQWSLHASSSGYDNVRAAGLDSVGNALISGVHGNGASLAVSSKAAPEVDSAATDNTYDQFVAKLDPQGNLMWYRRFAESSPMSILGGGELEVAADDTAYVTGGFQNRAVLKDLNQAVVASVADNGTNRASYLVTAIQKDGSLREAIVYTGTPGQSSAAGNTSSAVVTTRTLGNQLMVAVGLVLEGTGPLRIQTNSTDQTYPTSASTREFSASLFSTPVD